MGIEQDNIRHKTIISMKVQDETIHTDMKTGKKNKIEKLKNVNQ